jgi:FkbM family methyltransferase
MIRELARQLRRAKRKLTNGLLTFYAGVGFDPLGDMQHFVRTDRPMIFDAGANIGQSLRQFHDDFPNCTTHSFEPSPTTFEVLKQRAAGVPQAHLWNFALGAANRRATLNENEKSHMSSFLPLGAAGWGEIQKETQVEIRTVDDFCREQGIDRIDILKSDTQGFELEVFKGANETMRANRIGLIYFEVNFAEVYQNSPSFSELYDYLSERGFLLVTFYRMHYRNRHRKPMAAWTDVLFVHSTYLSGPEAAAQPGGGDNAS